MKKCIVIGGGFAGLATASFLSSNNFKVTLLESSPKAGGRAYSFIDKTSGDVIDNGQHILMGCYKETLAFLRLINAAGNFEYQKNLKVKFVDKNSNQHLLDASAFFYPFNLLAAILGYRAIDIKDQLRIIIFLVKLMFTNTEKLKNLSVREWLLKNQQSEKAINSLWAIIAIGALNTNIDKASAKIFAIILKQMFLKGNFNSTIILPSKGLSESYVEPAINFIKQNGGEVRLSQSVTGLRIEQNKIASVITSDGELNDFDFVISTVQHFALKKISGLENFPDVNYEYSSILTFHIWLKENQLENTFYGFIDSPVHWVFNKGTHLTLVISDANELVKKEDSELNNIAICELKKYLKIEPDNISDIKIIKEKRATFIPGNIVEEKRPWQKTNYNNFFIAGDWTSTSLPSTIESAVKSARIVSEIIRGSNED